MVRKVVDYLISMLPVGISVLDCFVGYRGISNR